MSRRITTYKKTDKKATGVVLAAILGFVAILSGVFTNTVLGFVYSLPFILLFVIVCLVYELIFSLTHRKPLSYEQAKALASCYAKEYLDKNYNFKKSTVAVNPAFKSGLNVTGRWYDIEEPLVSFPAYVSSLLYGKHHEWVVIAIEKDGIVRSMWANKGENRETVAFNCDLDDIIQRCHMIGGYTVLRFHNHPNPDPQHYTTLLASEQDFTSARACSEYICKAGINWYDFVCARNDFIQFYRKVSDSFEVGGKRTSDIVDRLAITPQMDYEYQKQYRKKVGLGRLLRNKAFIITAVIACTILFFFVGKAHDNTGTIPTETSVAGIDKTVTDNISEDYISNTLRKIPGVIDIEAATPENDQNDLLGEKCSSVVFFTYDKVDQSLFTEKATPTAKGTDGGGCIEVFRETEEANARLQLLKSTKLLAGGCCQLGSVIIRTSSKLNESEQEELQNLILSEIAKNPPTDHNVVDVKEKDEETVSVTPDIDAKSVEYELVVYSVSDGFALAIEKSEAGKTARYLTVQEKVNRQPVIAIADNAFQDCENLKNIELPGTLEIIGAYAFSNCHRILRFKLPDSIIEIGDYAFEGCSSLTELRIPGNVTRLEPNTFSGTNLQVLYIPDTCEIPEGDDPFGLGENCRIEIYETE